MAAGAPTGTITFLLTDVEGSTRTWERDPDGMRRAAVRQREIITAAVAAHRGHLPRDQGEGDSVVGAFARASDAAACAIDVQRAMGAESWPNELSIRVRIAIHTGEVELHDGNYYGVTVNRCARLRSTAHGGQIVMSAATADLARSAMPDGAGLRDLGVHRLQDLADPEHVFALTHADVPDDFPALRSLDALPNNLPAELTSFVGREDDIAQLVKAVKTTRLVTLTGAAGCGKTRLALQVAAEVLPDFAHGVWLVELAALTDAGLVPQEIATVVGVREQSGTSIADAVVDYLRSRHALLVIDNCEHLLAACAGLVTTLLRSCPELSIIATSREALAIAGETSWRVPSLAVPDAGDVPVEALAEYDSVRLFLDRAAASDPQFDLATEDVASIVQICRRLDGIPLAIELAAGRVALMPCEEIASRLDDRFSLLTGGSRAALERQQTLRAAVDWSYELLDERERALLRRLTVFDGGFTLDSVEQVCAADPISSSDILELLSHLVAKSLVVLERGTRRYALLEMIRQYAREELVKAQEIEQMRARHVEWCIGFVERCDAELNGPGDGVAIQRLHADADNVRAAIDWSVSRKDSGSALRLCLGAARFWDWRGHWTEALDRTRAALACGAGHDDVRARLLGRAAGIATWTGAADTALDFAQEAMACAERSGDKKAIAFAHHAAGLVAHYRGEPTAARVHYENGLSIGREIGDRALIGSALNNLGVLASASGDWQTAKRLFEECLSIARELGGNRDKAFVLGNLSGLASREGRRDEARALLEESRKVMDEIGDQRMIVSGLTQLGTRFWIDGMYDQAEEALREALDIHRKLGATISVSVTLCYLGYLEAERGNFDAARSLVRDALDIQRAAAFEGVVITGLSWLTFVEMLAGDVEAAAALGAEVLALAANVPDTPDARLPGLIGLAARDLATGDLVAARPRIEEFLSIAKPAKILHAYLGEDAMGRLLLAEGEVEQARHVFLEYVESNSSFGSKYEVAAGFDGLAAAAAAAGSHDRAARLVGAAEALRAAMCVPVLPSRRAFVDGAAAAARAALGDGAFERARQEGAALGYDEAVAFALEGLGVG